MSCEACHIRPVAVDDPGHIDSDNVAEIVFGENARLGGAEPSWDRDTLTCSGTYCHGASLGDGDRPLVWTEVSGNSCGSCHGLPPKTTRAGFHPDDQNCERCHSAVAKPNLEIGDVVLHGDGIVQVEGCNGGCHGDETRGDAAPPRDLQGYESSERVGAHQAHLHTAMAAEVLCEQCHAVPERVDVPSHIDSATPDRAEVIFAGRALDDLATPSYEPDALRCANTYCHGATLGDGTADVNWDDRRNDRCDFCHGMPPTRTRSGFSHTSNDQCELCHEQTSGPDQTIANSALHINGILEVAGECTNCHGDADAARTAPPLDLAGNSTSDEIGAHLAHLEPENSKAVQCGACHVIPADDSTHPVTPNAEGPATVTLSGLGLLGTVTSTYSAGAMRCSDTYCHSGSGATDPAPQWTATFDSDCSACHGMPPPAPHPANDDCVACHDETAGPNQSVSNVDVHMNGQVELNSACNGCHGDVAGDPDNPRSWAPPTGISGRDPAGVGAHQVHLASVITPVRCESCHLVPPDLEHVDTAAPADVALLAGGAYQAADRTCSDTACHLGRSPAWDSTFPDNCDGACHGSPPDTPSHQPDMTSCDSCHQNVAGQIGNFRIVDPTQHVDGDVQVDGGCNTCHGDPAGDQNNPLAWAPPAGIQGRDVAGIGAHQKHLASTIAAVACEDCHLVPTNLGHVDEFAPADVDLLNGGSYDSAARTCADSVCHPVISPAWTATFANVCDGACHDSPPQSASHDGSNGNDCEDCHDTAGPNLTIAIAAQHMNGRVEANGGACNACHGVAGDENDPRNWYPRTDAHAAHFGSTLNLGSMTWCESCHIVPADTAASGHIDDSPNDVVMNQGLGASSGLSPSYNGSTGQCSNVYCHGVTVAGGDNNPSWAGSLNGCAGCHGEPPSQGDHRRDDHREPCVDCHGHDGDAPEHIDVSVNLEFTGQASQVTATYDGTAVRCSGDCHDNHNNERW
jgi:predicted CxxxxCH...CXXCH cytochrome family protein